MRNGCSPSVCLKSWLVSAAVCVGAVPALAAAQTGPFFLPTRNVNTVGLAPPPGVPNPELIGNPLQKQRNEVSCDVSPSNPLVVLCGNNDYRGVETFGDSWIGLSMSTDGGLTWRSRLMPGFPTAPSGIAAADPVVKTVPGLGLVNYITISHTDGRGVLGLMLLRERNRENGEPYAPLGSRVIGNGTPGRFNDKPTMTAVLDGTSETVDVNGVAVPRGTVHVAYALFPGNDNNSASQIYHTFSRDWGRSWSQPSKLSESLGTNQGIELAVAGNTVVAVWRRMADRNERPAIMVARSTNGGASWSRAVELWRPGARQGFFDQDTTALQFRTRSLPTIVYDGRAFHAFWAARGIAGVAAGVSPLASRIVVASSRDGVSWEGPYVVDAANATNSHQLMPTVATAGGRLQVNWIDSRSNPRFSEFLTDTPLPLEECAPLPVPCIYRQSSDVYGAQAASAMLLASNRIRLAFGASQAISQYRHAYIADRPGGLPRLRQIEFNFINARMFRKGTVPFHGDYHAVAARRHRPSDQDPTLWVPNFARVGPNGTAFEDTTNAVFYSAFTDNRDATGYLWASSPDGLLGKSSFTPAMQGEVADETPQECVPVTTEGGVGTGELVTVVGRTDNTRSRFQNIYAAASLPGLIVTSPSAGKPSTANLERAYAVFIRNLTAQDRTYTLAIENQPPDAAPPGSGRASWRQADVTYTCDDGAACRRLTAVVPRGSSITRTVYVTSSVPRPRILVTVTEQVTGGQFGSVVLNGRPEIENPDGAGLPDIFTQETYQPDIITRQYAFFDAAFSNPDIVPALIATPQLEYPVFGMPREEYPREEYPREEYPREEYNRIAYPREEYPREEYPREEYSAIQNTSIQYSPLSDGQGGAQEVTEVTWPVTTDGANTLTAMAARVFVNGPLTGITGAQLLVTVPNLTSIARSCAGGPEVAVDNQVIVNTVLTPCPAGQTCPYSLADLAPTTNGGPDVVNPAIVEPSFFVRPGQVVYLTLRLVGRKDPALGRRAGVIVRSQADATNVDNDNDDIDGEIDVTAPTLTLPDPQAYAAVEGNARGGATVTVLVTAADENGIGSVGCTAGTTPLVIDGTGTNFFALGTTVVVCTAEDNSGNAVSGSFPVTVVDTTAPVLALPAPFSVPTVSPGGAVVTYTATAEDVVSGPVAVTCSPASGTTFPIGVTTVSCSASDAAGNTATGAFAVTVTGDATPPSGVVAAVSPTILWPPNGSIIPVTVSGTASDAGSGIARIDWRVVDEYGTHTPSASYVVPDNGAGNLAVSFSFQVPLLADRRGNDSDGRHYTIEITAVDRFGNRLVAARPPVVNVHDKSGF